MEGLAKEDFLEDRRTQQAVIMSLIIIGEAVTKVMDRYAAFAQAHGQVPWRNMRGMRYRIAHGYFDINLDVVWDTVQTALPELLKQLPAVRQDADGEDRNDCGTTVGWSHDNARVSTQNAKPKCMGLHGGLTGGLKNAR